MNIRNSMYLFICAISFLIVQEGWSDVSFVNTTDMRLIVQLLTPAYNEEGRPLGIAYAEEFILWEDNLHTKPKKKENAYWWWEASEEKKKENRITINPCLGYRKHVLDNKFVASSIHEIVKRSWLFFTSSLLKPATTFVVKGFFCLATKCRHGICGVVDKSADNCYWMETPQLVLQDGATYTISCVDDVQLKVTKYQENIGVPVERRPWKYQVVGTYFTVEEGVN